MIRKRALAFLCERDWSGALFELLIVALFRPDYSAGTAVSGER